MIEVMALFGPKGPKLCILTASKSSVWEEYQVDRSPLKLGMRRYVFFLKNLSIVIPYHMSLCPWNSSQMQSVGSIFVCNRICIHAFMARVSSRDGMLCCTFLGGFQCMESKLYGAKMPFAICSTVFIFPSTF